MSMNPDDETLTSIRGELEELAPMTMVLRPSSAFTLASLLQLALRHPGVGDGVRQIGETFIGHVRVYFADTVAVSEVLERGDDPTQDVPSELLDRPLALRLRYRVLGGHVHCRWFTAPDPTEVFAKAGDLVFTVEEWPSLCALLAPVVELLPETDA